MNPKEEIRYIYKVRDSKTGLHWTGDSVNVRFAREGMTFKTLKGIYESLERYALGGGRWSWTAEPPQMIPENWEIVKYEIKQREVDLLDTNKLRFLHHVKYDASREHWKFKEMIDDGEKRGYLYHLKYMVRIKGTQAAAFLKPLISQTDIDTAKKTLRGLGIKKSQYKLVNGMFGFFDEEHAMLAKMSLDIECMVNLEELFNKYKHLFDFEEHRNWLTGP